MMQMHYAPRGKAVCGYVAPDDEVCDDPKLCTCPECLDWIRPDHDSPTSGGTEP